MHDDLGLWKWFVQHVAIPLLSGLWAAIAWWVKMIADKFTRLEDTHKEELAAIHALISAIDREATNTYARRDDVREGFARIDGKLDVLLKHALKDSQG
jgi:hypothetical protein